MPHVLPLIPRVLAKLLEAFLSGAVAHSYKRFCIAQLQGALFALCIWVVVAIIFQQTAVKHMLILWIHAEVAVSLVV